MKDQKAYLISLGLHFSVILFILIVPTRSYVISQPSYIPVQLMDPREVIPEPEPPKVEKPKPPKVEPEEYIRPQEEEKIKTPTPVPTQKPSPTPKPTNTQKPTAKPSPTSKPTEKPTPKPTEKPTVTPTKKKEPSPLPTLRPVDPVIAQNQPSPIPLNRMPETPMAQPASPPIGVPSNVTIEGPPGVPLGPWGQTLNRILHNNWRPPSVRPPVMKTYTVAVKFVVYPDGSIADYKVVAPSGWPVLDETVKQAVERSNPLTHLPDRFLGGKITVTVPFQFTPR